MELPTGTVTFLFTDIEGSTKLLQELGEAYGTVQNDHMRLMREAIAAGDGIELRTEGDSFFAVFPSAGRAVQAAVAAQQAFNAHRWSHGQPIRVRMGMHTGEGRLGGDDYLGIDVNRAARIAAAGHGGQILLSDTTRSLVEHDLPDGVSLRDLGAHRLKDLAHAEHIHDVVIESLPSRFPPLKTLEIPVNLPAQLTSFVGREQQVEGVIEVMEQSRLVTLTGPGGTGKTRLAIEVASRVAYGFPDGTYFVDLAPIADPMLVPDTIASTLIVQQESSGRSSLEILTDHLSQRTVLLVLDNFEQVLSGAPTVDTLVRAAPRVRALVTSRAPLGLTGEQEFPVPPLALPDPGSDPTTLRRSEAVALFADRATAVDPTFALTEETTPVVAKICARLDGLPLAIELAASRIRVLPAPLLLEQLERRLPMLVGGVRDRPARHRTLAAAIAWSYDLLEEPKRYFFQRLSVFAGGWTLEAANVVAGLGRELGEVIEVMDLLLQNSLVHRVSGDPEGRMRMLETIREFGLERLEESEEAEDVRQRHARRFLNLAEQAEPYLTAAEQRRWLDQLSREHDNLRAALAWAIQSDRGEMALRLGSALWRFWYARGHLEEGHRWLQAALSLSSSRERTTPRARCLTALGGIAYWQNHFETAHTSYIEALEIHRELGDRGATVQALFNLATAKGVMGEPEVAEALLEESLATARELGDRRGEGWALWGLSAAHMFGGDFDASQKYAQESLRIFEEVQEDTWGLGNALAALAGVASKRGDPGEARERILMAIDAWEEQGNALLLASQLRFLAMVANDSGQPERAVRLAGFAAGVREKVGGQVPDAFFPFADPREVAAKVLDQASVNRAWAEGSAMSLEDALAYAREG